MYTQWVRAKNRDFNCRSTVFYGSLFRALIYLKHPSKGFKIMSRFEYIEALWWMMHHSDDPHRRSFVVFCYLDDSGSHENGVLAVMGGPIIPKKLFSSFHLD